MEELLAYRQELLSDLEGDIALLAKLKGEISHQGWFHRVSDNGPTPHFMLTRLLAEDAHGFVPPIRRILDEEMAQLPVFEIDAWMADNYDPDEPAGILIENFASLRAWEVSLLCGLPPASWSRLARHPRWGVHTLQWWVEQQREVFHQNFAQLLALLDV